MLQHSPPPAPQQHTVVVMQPGPYTTPPHGAHQVAWTPSAQPPGMVPSPEVDLMRGTHQVSQASMLPMFALGSTPQAAGAAAYGPYFTHPATPKSQGSGFKSTLSTSSTKMLVACGCIGVLVVGGAMAITFLIVVT